MHSLCSQPLPPRGGDFLEDLRQAARQVPLGVVRLHFAQVAVVADVVAAARLVQIGVNLLLAGAGLRHFKGFQDGAGVVFAAAEIIDLASPGRLIELEHEARHIHRMDVVANLLHYFPEMVITTKAAVEGVDDLINIHHNYASQEHHFGKNLFVHRKGATLANAKTIGIIPGSQQTNSFITKGMGNHLSLFSSSHGSGRKMGRKDFNVQYQDKVGEIEVSMKDKGIVFTPFKKASRGRDEGMYDISESGGAYKDVISIMEDQKDLVSALVKLFPMINWKG